MSEKTLSKQDKLALKARAHHLNPVVMVGQRGLTEAVIQETETALRAHELIKVRVFGDEREERLNICAELCAATGAQLIQHIGKLLVLYRKNEDEKAAE
ncbi:ribosome assembly RNA-binding protein YhbY [Alysiella filiformis]|uniref:RNA-binding protein n=1 Tax=Alysiella filiformis DSM 16848 TaxID=1120981 RepID=A0A286ECB2_9NEIS|nr:ribosome assembly RNA-binding protein YhbY [Alysiella filiformis]QMT30575.1 ribosome assembly RNA-binding protein YhbY [Alysiella filiformis]UBQ56445.1 ribosome assembly RNA-binding protein YhbY [Alysiella filiformis DSM 16848]SOD68575.1 RNA-binding protein [Alysiella filiformis DSM 16848]